MQDMKNLKSFFELFITFFKIGAVTFGGGYAMLPILERELVEKKAWTTNDDLLDYFAISQATPGVIAVNVSTFIGNKIAGNIGGIIATIGVVCPSLIIITIIATFISNFADIIWVQKALAGINVAVASLLTSSVYKLAKKSVKNLFSLILFLLAFFAIFCFNIGSVLVIIAGAVLGIVVSYFKAKENIK